MQKPESSKGVLYRGEKAKKIKDTTIVVGGADSCVTPKLQQAQLKG